jgi:hypothetical protein
VNPFTRADAAQKHNPIQAEAENSTVSGGAYNLYTSISGGCDNLAAASGGALTLPSGVSCHSSGAQFVSGGEDNKAEAEWTSVTGGNFNKATVTAASVSGGYINTASGSSASDLDLRRQRRSSPRQLRHRAVGVGARRKASGGGLCLRAWAATRPRQPARMRQAGGWGDDVVGRIAQRARREWELMCGAVALGKGKGRQGGVVVERGE